jgi:hypothetical protein
MSDDFDTVNVNRGQRAREIEVMRAHYRRHRETLRSMIADAPTETLAAAYQRLVQDIEGALTKLDDLEGRGTSSAPLPLPVVPSALEQPLRLKTDTDRPPTHTMYEDDEPTHTDYVPPYENAGGGKGRTAIMVIAGLLVLVAIGWLVWRRNTTSKPNTTIVEQPVDANDTAPVTETTSTGGLTSTAELLAAPAAHNYGTIRKGTRATRQFEINNRTDAPITVSVSRSACRCLFYEYVELIPPKGKESVTVTIDGARAKAGDLHETLKVTSKRDPAISTTIDVQAVIR